MPDESIHNNPYDVEEERFVKLEEQVVDTSHNMAFFMVNLVKHFGHFLGGWWL
jgi:hypothetical protein